MSCQQVPRITTEDPYTFTEPPVTTNFFNSQIHKLTPIKPVSKIQLSHQLNNKQQNRYNGSGFANGTANSHHLPIYANSQQQQHQVSLNQQIQKQQQQQQHQQPTKTLQQQQKLQPQKCITKRLLVPPPPTLPPISCSKSITTANSSPPPLYQTKPPRPFFTDSQKSQINHSITTTASNAYFTNQPQQQQQPKQLPHLHLNNHQQNNTSLQEKQRSPPKQTQLVAGYSNFGVVYPSLLPPTKVKNENNTIYQQQQPCKSETNGSSSNGNIAESKNVAKLDNLSNTNTFAKPKLESKVLVAAGKKSTGKSQTSAARTNKRSYSQSSHHEALQRISISSSSSSRQSQNVASYITTATRNREWHAPDSYIFDYAGPSAPTPEHLELQPFTQNVWFRNYSTLLNREQRLEIKRNFLRRQAHQWSQAQRFRSTALAKRRFVTISKTLQKLEVSRETKTISKCGISSCSNDALALTAYCYLHITLNTDQKLFHPCTAKFSDNSQCRVPVFDISHELPLCREHAWKRDNYNRILQEQKPKKPPRKKPKPSAMTRPPKRNKKKKKPLQKLHNVMLEQNNLHGMSDNAINNHDTIIKSDQIVQIISASDEIKYFHHHNNYNNDENFSQNEEYIVTTPGSMSTQEMITICENSSAYESSEDTGVGGLSESELIGVPDEIPLGDARLLEEHDLNNVLNQLPADAFNELFTVQQNDHYEPTQEEQEDLERALEAVDEQVKSLEQLTGSQNFLANFLDDDDEMLVDESDTICTDIIHSPTENLDMRNMVHT